MWLRIALFEIRYRLRSWPFWILLLAITAAVIAFVGNSNAVIGSSNCDWNAGFLVQEYYSIFAIFSLLTASMFVGSTAVRDFAARSDQIVFATPIRKFDYLAGRFCGSTLMAALPMTGISIGFLAARYAPWVSHDGVFQPARALPHLSAFLLFALPNALFIGAILFTAGVLSRSSTVPLVATICILTAYLASRAYLNDLPHERIAAFLDPFGSYAFAVMTKYWDTADKNRLLVGLTGPMLWNRVIWVPLGLATFIYGCLRFRFAPIDEAFRGQASRFPEQTGGISLSVPKIRILSETQSPILAAFVQLFRFELRALLRTVSFWVIVACGLAIMLANLIAKATEGYGNTAFPVTYKVLELIQVGTILFAIVIVLHFAGIVVWRERDSGTHELCDALPIPEWVSYAAKFCAVLAPVLIFQFTGIAAGLAVQCVHHYYRFQFGVYAFQLLGLDLLAMVFLAVLAFLCHVLAPNRYVAYLVYILFLTADNEGWKLVNVATNMVKFGEVPEGKYSDFFGWSPYLPGLLWFHAYWATFCGLLVIATILLWPRGADRQWRYRRRNAKLRLQGPVRRAAIYTAAVFVGAGAVVFYNTEIRNSVQTDRDRDRIQASYERAYKKYQFNPQPRVTSVKYAIDLYPESRSAVARIEETVRNNSAAPISQLHLDYPGGWSWHWGIPGGKSAKFDNSQDYEIIDLSPPLAPGESRVLKFIMRKQPSGFTNDPPGLEIAPNGTFLHSDLKPHIGYRRAAELTHERWKYGLQESHSWPAVRNCEQPCDYNYVSDEGDWVDIQTVISTSPDQIAIAPGSLIREWRANGRRYFEYRPDHSMLDFYSFLSGTYEVSREQFGDIQIEIYYLKEHPWNVSRMRQAVRKSLEYFTAQFGPYPNHQARIIEFPRTVDMAQAFPGTMPYSESIGFIANLEHPQDIDHVYYVVAHEMAHQWWADQIIGADVQGARLLSESLAQYSALMVMEKQYGRDMMRKFLAYELDNYLRGRAAYNKQELPLANSDSDQTFVFYNKASLVMYCLRERIGDEAVNRALRRMLAKYRYAPPPYPTSFALTDALRAETPSDLQYLIRDLFEKVTFFNNRTVSATATRLPDGKYDVAIQCVVSKSQLDGNGQEYLTPLNDVIEIGALSAKGKVLARQSLRVITSNASETTLTRHITTGELPAQAGVDPLSLLIDKSPGQNLRKVDVVSTHKSASASH
jgi:hypothetical protein